MKIYRACITGRRNSDKISSCQDFCEYMMTKDKELAVALSDGAGSSEFPDFASRENVHAFLNFFRLYPVKEMLNINNDALAEDMILFCNNAQSDLSDRINTDISNLKATLIGLAIGEEEILVYHIGDGKVYTKLKTGEIECFSDSDNFLGISNRTYFTTDKNAVKHMRVTRLKRENVRKICIFSDGVFGTKEDISEDMEAIFEQAEDDFSLGKLIDTDSMRNYGDDCSMVLVDLE